MTVGLPISLIFVILILLSQVLLQYLNYQWADPGKDHSGDPFWLKYMPSFINVLLIGIFGQIYTRLSYRLVRNENHQFMTGLENSMINKTYMFQFVNVYISNLVYIFYY